MVGQTRLIAVAAVLIAGGVTAALVSSDSPKNPTSITPRTSETESERAGCAELPTATDTPSWFPSDLPLPGDSYATSEEVGQSTESDSAIFVVDTNLDGFIQFAAQEWPASGWLLSGGEREAHEAEAPFRKGSVTGRFRARSVYCETDKTEVLLSISKT